MGQLEVKTVAQGLPLSRPCGPISAILSNCFWQSADSFQFNALNELGLEMGMEMEMDLVSDFESKSKLGPNLCVSRHIFHRKVTRRDNRNDCCIIIITSGQRISSLVSLVGPKALAFSTKMGIES